MCVCVCVCDCVVCVCVLCLYVCVCVCVIGPYLSELNQERAKYEREIERNGLIFFLMYISS